MLPFTTYFSLLLAYQKLVFYWISTTYGEDNCLSYFSLEFGVLTDFNKLRCKDNCLSFSFPKTLVRAAIWAYKITLLSSKGNGSSVDIDEILFIIIQTA